MAKKEFSKFFIASLKRTAQNVYPLVRQKEKLNKTIKEAQEELGSIQAQLDAYEAPIKEATGGFGTEDLVVREVVATGKMDKNGKELKSTVYKLKYPETVVPEVKEDPAVDGIAEGAWGQEEVKGEQGGEVPSTDGNPAVDGINNVME